MSFVRIRTINGRKYRYEEARWREGGKVRSRSRSLGPIDGARISRRRRSWSIFDFIGLQRLSVEERILASAMKEAERIEQYQREVFGETASERAVREWQEFLDKLHLAYGLKLGPTPPTPVEPGRVPTHVEVSCAQRETVNEPPATKAGE